MTIKELEALTGLSRANIRFYEKEGLLSPLRRENGYREYTEEDVQTLQRIKLLRSLQFSIEEIRTPQNKSSSLSDVMAIHLQKLAQSKKELEQVESICRAIHRDQVEFEQLNAPYYWKKLSEKSEYNPAPLLEDKEPLPANPWRRLFARLFDHSLYQILWMAIIVAVLQISLSAYLEQMAIWSMVEFLLGTVTMVFVEPLWLRYVGTTPGKILFGLRFTEKMPYRIGLRRTIDVIRYGFGYFIPAYRLVCFWRAYWSVAYGEVARWDEGMSYVDAKPWRWYKIIVPILGHMILFGLLISSMLVGQRAPNQGSLTVEEFAENYNFYADYHNIGWPYYLNEKGEWYDETVEKGAVVVLVDLDPENPDTFAVGEAVQPAMLLFEQEDGEVVGVTFSKSKDGYAFTNNRINCLALALMGAQPEFTPFSNSMNQLLNQQKWTSLGMDQQHTYEDCGVSVEAYAVTNDEVWVEIRLKDKL